MVRFHWDPGRRQLVPGGGSRGARAAWYLTTTGERPRERWESPEADTVGARDDCFMAARSRVMGRWFEQHLGLPLDCVSEGRSQGYLGTHVDHMLVRHELWADTLLLRLLSNPYAEPTTPSSRTVRMVGDEPERSQSGRAGPISIDVLHTPYRMFLVRLCASQGKGR